MAYLAMDPAHICRAFFILSTTFALGTTVSPFLRKLASYGPRTLPASEISSTEAKRVNSNALDKFANLQVPHTWFTHFYGVCVASSAFWGCQIAVNRAVFRLLASQYVGNIQAAMTMNQIALTWVLMTFQGSRRLYESITLLKPSTSKMPLASYAVGILFYLATCIAVWAEGIRESQVISFTAQSLIVVATLLSSRRTLEQITISKPSARTILAVLLFLIASGIQHDSHVYLASLKKYTLPERHLFQWIICPHYTSECAIYLALSIVAAPRGQMLNRTISTVLMFTIVNLAITSESTRAWYVQKFGVEKIKQRSRMLPLLY